jgi:hypothetical protein
VIAETLAAEFDVHTKSGRLYGHRFEAREITQNTRINNGYTHTCGGPGYWIVDSW